MAHVYLIGLYNIAHVYLIGLYIILVFNRLFSKILSFDKENVFDSIVDHMMKHLS